MRKTELLERIANGKNSGMEVLRDYGYVDYRGMGVRTKIVPLTRALTGKEPEFLATNDYLKTSLYRSLYDMAQNNLAIFQVAI